MSHLFNQSCPIGAGLRAPHYSQVLDATPKRIKWFEAVSENYMDSFGRPRQTLNKIREQFAVALHGVSLSIGAVEPVDFEYLKRLKNLCHEIDPFIVSDHMCWTGASKANLHDLLPLPYTYEAIHLISEKVEQVQDFLGRPILLENVSSYLSFDQSEMPEYEFLNQITQRSGCGLLLDINNVFVSASNHGFDAGNFLNQIRLESVGQIHLAGHTDMGKFLFDTHSKPVQQVTWELFDQFIKCSSSIPILLEWDGDLPSFYELENEAMKAKLIWEKYHGTTSTKNSTTVIRQFTEAPSEN